MWVCGKVYGLLTWAYLSLVPFVGEAGALVVMFMILFFSAIILFEITVHSTQGGIERSAKGVLGIAVKVFGVFIVFVLILFVLSQSYTLRRKFNK